MSKSNIVNSILIILFISQYSDSYIGETKVKHLKCKMSLEVFTQNKKKYPSLLYHDFVLSLPIDF